VVSNRSLQLVIVGLQCYYNPAPFNEMC